MGNKLNLFNLRNHRYKAMWYASKNTYHENLLKDYKIRKFIMDESRKLRLDIADVVIYGTTNIKIDLHTSKPGFVLGKGGANINELKNKIANIAGMSPANLNINLVTINKPELNADLIALRIAQDLERRRSYNQTMRTHAEEAIKFGALGVRVECAGRLNGVEIARRACLSRGTVPRNTIRANIFYSNMTAYTKYGTCGVKVWINLNRSRRKDGENKPSKRFDFGHDSRKIDTIESNKDSTMTGGTNS